MARTLTKRERRLLIIGACFAVLYTFYRFVFFPQWEDYLLVKEELKSKQEYLITVEKIYSKVQQFAKDNEKKLNDLNDLKSFNMGNDGTILIRLDDIAYEHELELNLYQPLAVAKGQIPSKLVEAKITGSYDGIIEFFKELDNLPYLTKITVKYIKPLAVQNSAGNKRNILQEKSIADFTLEIFNMPEQRPSGKAGNRPVSKVIAKPNQTSEATPVVEDPLTTLLNLIDLANSLESEGETTVGEAYQ